MKNLSDIKSKIEEIRNSDFKIEDFDFYGKNHKISILLRIALICTNAISSIDNISKEKKRELYKELDEVMKSKFRKLNPNFSEETLNNMISGYKRGYIVYPIDILVVDDAVFHKEGVFNDFDSIYKIKTFMFQGENPYYDVSDMYFTDDGDFLFGEKKWLTNEEAKITSKFISDNINSIYEANITRPIYELNTARSFYGYSGLASGEIREVNVYINMKHGDIGRSIKGKEECDFKLCIQNGNDITLYYIHQNFKDNEPIWNVVKTNSEVWSLTEQALKSEKECEDDTHKLIKRRK